MGLTGTRPRSTQSSQGRPYLSAFMMGVSMYLGSLHNIEPLSTSHGGSAVSQYLRQELHGIFESVNKSHIPELFGWIKEIGGYFKRFRGGALTPWIHNTEGTPELDLEARATQAFFEVGPLHPQYYLTLIPCFSRLTKTCRLMIPPNAAAPPPLLQYSTL